MLGGYDMNQFGVASQGKLIEKKNVAEAFTSGHGSPFVAQVSMANAAKLYKAMLDGLEYRGTAFFQCFTTCQPEHGVGDDMSADQAKLRARRARHAGVRLQPAAAARPTQEAFDLKGNPSHRPRLVATRSSPAPARSTVTPWRTGRSPKAASAST